ncbi:VWA domain-containing protein [Kolteria novifilia]|uniref:VWA domain-containing protein n=1 Tax=Kolteria novifilia TaxID=2527975 RepID=UPI003AF3B247
MPIVFLAPWWLLLLAVVPLVVWQSWGGLSGLGPIRRPLAVFLRVVVIVLVVLALADLRLEHPTDRYATLFVLDVSESVPQEAVEDSLHIITDAVADRPSDLDQAGLIVLGRNARIEAPPAEYPRNRRFTAVESLIDRQHSDLAAGIKLALGSFPPDSSKRIVLFSDGNENRGNVLAQALAARQIGVPIDVVPIEYRYDSEILVDRISVPPDLKKGDTANLKVVIRSAGPASGTVQLNRRSEGVSETVLEQDVTLRPGLNVFFLKQTIDEPDLYRYVAEFIPRQGEDVRAANNRGSAFVWVRGEGRVLLLEPSAGQHAPLVDALRRDGLAVSVRTPDQLEDGATQFRPYDSIILANVPAELLSEELQEILASNTRELGAGLIMVGGPDSFGAGGYIGSPIEKALPVDMQIKASRIQGKGALVLIMHACEIPEGNFWQKKIAQLAIKMLSQRDECGLIHWSGKASWLFPLQEVNNGRKMLARVDGMVPGDMPDFAGPMRMALNALLKSQATNRHVIIISDGDPQPPPKQLLQSFIDAKITITTVAVAAHGFFEKKLMKQIASATGGRYYQAESPKALPSIYIKETRVVSRPLIFEQQPSWNPIIRFPSQPVAGLPTKLPAIGGYVLTTPKPTAEVSVVSPIPGENEINPILATWQYGLGKSAAFTTDTGSKWAVGWPDTEIFPKLWSQLVRWSLRSEESDDLVLSTVEKDGRVQVVVNAFDQAKEYLDFLALKGTVVLPDGQTESLAFRQTGPGKYESSFEASDAGSYSVRVGSKLGEDKNLFATTGFNISYPPEYRELESDRGLLESVAELSGGRVLERAQAAEAGYFDRSTPPSPGQQRMWPWLLLVALGLFVSDVAVRRIAISPADVANTAKALWARLRNRPPPATTATLDRLRSRKETVGENLSARQREHVIPKPPPAARPSEPTRATTPPPPPPPAAPSESSAEGDADHSMTSRLLKAKRRVWEEREGGKEGSQDETK